MNHHNAHTETFNLTSKLLTDGHDEVANAIEELTATELRSVLAVTLKEYAGLLELVAPDPLALLRRAEQRLQAEAN